ncbi:hypothetical protein ILUMI_00115 [Ignelater luminosus]|uniref:PiggyBac transposable element-derived protein domain-containing protein n=1 Tax=Ignelater luminosus TaxID=2038154 RepID=A0A8K0DMG1_IGNLU|nr:hypothetical protein ILUMI_00115 [Ignelater luminosus]
MTDCTSLDQLFIDHFNEHFLKVPLEIRFCIDKRYVVQIDHFMKQYLPMKSNKWGFKLFVSCADLAYNGISSLGRIPRNQVTNCKLLTKETMKNDARVASYEYEEKIFYTFDEEKSMSTLGREVEVCLCQVGKSSSLKQGPSSNTLEEMRKY